MARQSRRLLIAVLMLILSPALDAAQRTFVSAGSGSDAHNCSRLSPCRNFAAALAQTDNAGEVVVLDSGGYGTVEIIHSVSLISPEGVYAGITALSGDGFPSDGAIVINAGANDRVILRGLSINSLGGSVGVNFIAGKELGVYGVTVTNFSIFAIWARPDGAHTVIRDSVITGISGNVASDGIVIGVIGGSTAAAYGTIENTLINHAYECVHATDYALVTVTNSVATGCLGRGYRANGPGAEITIEHSSAVYANEGLLVGCTAGIGRISNSTFVNNWIGVRRCAGTLYTRGNNTIHGNGTDINGTLTPLGAQ